jgi:photosystem II stability/assembly factor-like uncharacterized protein
MLIKPDWREAIDRKIWALKRNRPFPDALISASSAILTMEAFMQCVSRRLIVAGTLACVLARPVWAQAGGAPRWKKLTTVAYKGKQDDISFVDALTGWYGNGEGKLYRTTDAGENWTKVWDQPGTFIRALGFVDDKVGYLGNVGTDYYPGVTDKNPLYKTTDGGDTWIAVTAPGIENIAGICGIDILLVKRIYQGELRTSHIVTAAGRVGGPAMMLRSEDGGQNWRVIDLSVHAGMILDVKFHDAKNGFVCASGVSATGEGDALILATRDGGKSWKPVWRSRRSHENCWKMNWPTRNIGYATVQSYNAAAGNKRVVVKTIDGGKTWKEMPLFDEANVREFGIGFVDQKRGWVGTTHGGFETRDGGRSWHRIEFGRAVNKIRVIPKAGGGTVVYAIGSDVYRLDLD